MWQCFYILKTRVLGFGATDWDILIMHSISLEKREQSQKWEEALKLIRFCARSGTFIVLSRSDTTLGDALPSSIHCWGSAQSVTEWWYSASWIRLHNFSCWPTNVALSSIHVHDILTSEGRSEVWFINCNYTLWYPGNTDRGHSGSGIQKPRPNQETKPEFWFLFCCSDPKSKSLQSLLGVNTGENFLQWAQQNAIQLSALVAYLQVQAWKFFKS